MNKIKNVIMCATAAVLAVSACALSACGKKPEDGTIAGNYEEATMEQVTETLSNVDMGNAMGDPTAEDFKFGLNVNSSFNAAFTVGESSKASAGLSAGYTVLLTKNSCSGAGNAEISYDADIKAGELGEQEAVKESGKYSATVYNDATYVYGDFNLGKKDDGETDNIVKAKFNYGELLGSIMENIGNILPGSGASGITPYAEGNASIAGMLANLNMQAGMDTTDGIKIKLSITKDTFWGLLENSTPELPEDQLTQIKEALLINRFNYDVYFALDKTNKFSAASVVLDIDMSVDTSKMGMPMPTDEGAEQPPVITVKMNGYFKAESYLGEAPKLPDGMTTDLTYVDMTAVIKGMISGSGNLPLA